ncbi:DNA-directed RNA polymerase I subunit RPA34.5 [Fragilaria crotonensis]|nr:DNA-directed RNA polymerase I subunit RPA34.5 [Fragilaria crotonensis]
MSSSEEVDASHASGESDDSDAESEEAEAKNDPLRLPPSSFSMPAEDADFELWTIRMPVSVDHTALHGTKLSLDNKILGMIQSGDQKYGVVLGEAFENESFRVLVEGENEFMVPTTCVPFAKHLNVVHYDAIKEISQTDLAPGVDRAPTPIDPIRKAYSVVPQKTGLKRRWMPSGVPPASTQTKKAQDFMEGLLEYHARHVHKGSMSGVTEIKDASPMKSPPPKPKRKKDLNDADHDQLQTQENATPTRRKIKLETVVNENEAKEKENGSTIQLKKDPSIEDDSEEKRSAKKAKKEAKKAKKAKKEAKKAKKEKRESIE